MIEVWHISSQGKLRLANHYTAAFEVLNCKCKTAKRRMQHIRLKKIYDIGKLSSHWSQLSTPFLHQTPSNPTPSHLVGLPLSGGQGLHIARLHLVLKKTDVLRKVPLSLQSEHLGDGRITVPDMLSDLGQILRFPPRLQVPSLRENVRPSLKSLPALNSVLLGG